jgi:hypothetical protein
MAARLSGICLGITLAIAVTIGVFANGQPVRVLFVGNSLTYFNAMPSLVGKILANSIPRIDMRSEMLAQGGATIRDHLIAGVVQRTLKATHFDVVVFQELGGFPACPSDFRGCSDSPNAIEEMVSVIKAAGARPIWFSTWQPSRDAQERLSAGAESLARKLHIDVADAGALIYRYIDENPAAPILRSDGHPQPLGSWIIADVLASMIQPHTWRGSGSIEVCGPEWRGHELKFTMLSSRQKQPPQACFSLPRQQMMEIQKLERISQ